MSTRGRVRSPDLNRNDRDQFVGLRSKTSSNEMTVLADGCAYRPLTTTSQFKNRVASAQRQRSLFVLMFRFLSPTLLGCLLALAMVPLAPAQNLPNTTRLLRFPTTNGRQIVFCYAGELYTAAKDGGLARRLTSGPGYSSFPRFSADGSQIAFTSQYDGNTEVYVIPAEGGAPKRLTTTPTLGLHHISY